MAQRLVREGRTSTVLTGGRMKKYRVDSFKLHPLPHMSSLHVIIFILLFDDVLLFIASAHIMIAVVGDRCYCPLMHVLVATFVCNCNWLSCVYVLASFASVGGCASVRLLPPLRPR